MKVLLIALVLCLCCFLAQGQTATPVTTQTTAPVPANFAGFGFGYQKTGAPSQVSGWSSVCHQVTSVPIAGMTLPTYLCNANDYFPGATSVRANLDQVWLQKGWFAAGTKTGAGAAISGSGVGGSFDLGGWAAADLSKVINVPGLRLLGSLTWEKDDIAVAAQQTTAKALFHTLGARTQVRVGFGKTW